MPLMIRYVGFFDQDALISAVNNWLKKNKFDIDNQKITKKEGALGEYEISLDCSRSVTAYAKYTLTIKISERNLVDAEVKTDDGIKKIKKGSLDVDISYDTLDNTSKYTKDIKKPWIKKLFGKVEYGEMKQIKDHLDELMQDLYNEVKKSLQLYSTQ